MGNSKRLNTPGRPHKATQGGYPETALSSVEAPAFDLASSKVRDLPCNQIPRQLETSELPSPGAPVTPARPVTPSWLDPPWPRQEVQFQSWSRPGTASTVCDEADMAQ